MLKIAVFALVAALSTVANGEQHVIRFENAYLQTGEFLVLKHTQSADVRELGHCGFNGDDCTLLETTLNNPVVPGGGSSTDISLISPYVSSAPGLSLRFVKLKHVGRHTFSVRTGFRYAIAPAPLFPLLTEFSFALKAITVDATALAAFAIPRIARPHSVSLATPLSRLPARKTMSTSPSPSVFDIYPATAILYMT
ncbi:hypothetical protein DXG01_006646 [Tephrocybe rancida]|nr:hypothetical protein DXG01_006646 [Tephrocybe rancida]